MSTTENDARPTAEAAPAKAKSFEEVIATARLPERIVDLPLRGDLLAELDALVLELNDLTAQREEVGTAERKARSDALQERVQHLRQESAAGTVRVRLRAVTSARAQELSEKYRLTAEKEQRKKDRDFDAFIDELLSESIIEPRIESVDDVRKLRSTLSGPLFRALSKAAMDLFA